MSARLLLAAATVAAGTGLGALTYQAARPDSGSAGASAPAAAPSAVSTADPCVSDPGAPDCTVVVTVPGGGGGGLPGQPAPTFDDIASFPSDGPTPRATGSSRHDGDDSGHGRGRGRGHGRGSDSGSDDERDDDERDDDDRDDDDRDDDD